jgi:hypothetical protein
MTVLPRRTFLASTAAALAWAALPRTLRAAAESSAAPRVPIGMNLTGITDWEPGFPFRNLMAGARVWITRDVGGDGPWDTEQLASLPLDENGYPREIPFRGPGRDAPQEVVTILPNQRRGRYVLLHEGDGDFDGAQALRIHRETRRPGRVELSIGEGGYAVLILTRSNPADHLRAIRIVELADEGADLDAKPFRSDFMEFLRPWHCIRFMDWQATNNSHNHAWSARSTRSFYSQAGGGRATLDPAGPDPVRARWAAGVALEHCIAAANLARKDAWLCVPHLADDDYIERMALLVRETLDPRLKVYVEFSNEIWNWQFSQAQWMIRSRLAGDLHARQGLDDEPAWKLAPSSWGGEWAGAHAAFALNGEGHRHPERIAALFRRCFEIWERVFSGPHRARLVRVCSTQFGWFDVAQRTLTRVMETGGCDAYSPAHYFGPDDAVYSRWEAAGSSLTADQVMDDMLAVIAAEEAELARHSALARRHKVALVAYEAGQHIQSRHQADTAYSPALAAVQRHPRMHEAYLKHLAHWQRHGGGLWCAFASVSRQGTRYGSWGHLERYDQPPAEMPKFAALLDANLPR